MWVYRYRNLAEKEPGSLNNPEDIREVILDHECDSQADQVISRYFTSYRLISKTKESYRVHRL